MRHLDLFIPVHRSLIFHVYLWVYRKDNKVMDFIIDGILENLSEFFSAIVASKPLRFIEKNIKNKIVCSIVQVLVLLLCTIVGVAIAVGLVIGIIAIAIYFFDN